MTPTDQTPDAVRAAISVEAVTHIGHFMRDASHFDPEYDQWVLDELDAAARAGDGAT